MAVADPAEVSGSVHNQPISKTPNTSYDFFGALSLFWVVGLGVWRSKQPPAGILSGVVASLANGL